MAKRDELEQRRRKRAAHKKKQQEDMRRKLIVAGVLFLACLGLVIYLVRDVDITATPDPSNPAAEIFTEPPTEERATQPPSTPTTTIHIKAAGDLNVTDKVVASGKASFGVSGLCILNCIFVSLSSCRRHTISIPKAL